jgi:hypothetical protein
LDPRVVPEEAARAPQAQSSGYASSPTATQMNSCSALCAMEVVHGHRCWPVPTRRRPGRHGRDLVSTDRHAGITKAAAGAASTTMGSYASRPTHSWPRNGRGFPPQHLLPSSAPLAYPVVSARGALPVRPERHVPTSIATMYRLHGRALLAHTPCLSCGREPQAGLAFVTQ